MSTANLNPVFAGIPANGRAALATAETSLTAPTNAVQVIAAATEGTIVNRVNVKAKGSTTAGMIRLFIKVSSTYYLREEIGVDAITPSGTTKAFSSDSLVFTPGTPVVLKTGESLWAATHNAESFTVSAEAADLTAPT